MEVKGRRLHHLGGAEFQMPAIECAKKLGCFVITADNRPDNPSHRLSDLYVNVSTVDREAVLTVARQHHDVGIPFAVNHHKAVHGSRMLPQPFR